MFITSSLKYSSGSSDSDRPSTESFLQCFTSTEQWEKVKQSKMCWESGFFFTGNAIFTEKPHQNIELISKNNLHFYESNFLEFTAESLRTEWFVYNLVTAPWWNLTVGFYFDCWCQWMSHTKRPINDRKNAKYRSHFK